MDNQEINKKNNKSTGRIIFIILIIVILLGFACFKMYIDNDYKPNKTIEEYQKLTNNEIEITDNIYSIQDQDSLGTKDRIGFIFYSGEKISGKCYLPLMAELSNMGYSAFLPTTFGNIPVLNIEGAEYAIRTYSGIKNWYIIAHGGACQTAAQYINNYPGKIRGVIFLGGYTSEINLSEQNIKMLSIIGSQDTVVSKESYEKYKINNPKNTTYSVIDGGNHTNFADTKLIKGDTKGSLSISDQINETAQIIDNYIK